MDLHTMVDRIIHNFPGVKLDTNTKKPIIGALLSVGRVSVDYWRAIMDVLSCLSFCASNRLETWY